MTLIRNTTRLPLRVPLAGGKTLHLGPLKTGRVSNDSLERASFLKLLESGSIEVVGDGDLGSFSGGKGSKPHEETHGHHPPTGNLTRGNR